MGLDRAYLIWVHLHIHAAHPRKSHEILSDRLSAVVTGETGGFPILIRHRDLSYVRLANEGEFSREGLYVARTLNWWRV